MSARSLPGEARQGPKGTYWRLVLAERKLIGLVMFAAMAAVLVLVLKALHWLPTALDKGAVREYRSIEEVSRSLGIKDIYVPVYFPQSYRWPPSRIIAQGTPFVSVVMEFEDVRRGGTGLVIRQSESEAFPKEDRIGILNVRERVSYVLNGRSAVLEVGFCEHNVPCSRIFWKEGSYAVSVAAKSAPFDLLRLADSMAR